MTTHKYSYKRPENSNIRLNTVGKQIALGNAVIVTMRRLHLPVWLMVLGFAAQGFSQALTDTSNATLTATLPFGTLTAGTSNTPDSVTVQFRIRDKNAAGYNLQVTSATFTPTTTAAVDGGSTIAASDIGVGIVSVTPSPAFNGVTPRNDVISSGFDYDPGTITGTNGLTDRKSTRLNSSH